MRRLVLLFKDGGIIKKIGFAYIAEDITGSRDGQWKNGQKGKGKEECILQRGFFAEQASPFYCYDAFYSLLFLCSTLT